MAQRSIFSNAKTVRISPFVLAAERDNVAKAIRAARREFDGTYDRINIRFKLASDIHIACSNLRLGYECKKNIKTASRLEWCYWNKF